MKRYNNTTIINITKTQKKYNNIIVYKNGKRYDGYCIHEQYMPFDAMYTITRMLMYELQLPKKDGKYKIEIVNTAADENKDTLDLFFIVKEGDYCNKDPFEFKATFDNGVEKEYENTHELIADVLRAVMPVVEEGMLLTDTTRRITISFMFESAEEGCAIGD